MKEHLSLGAVFTLSVALLLFSVAPLRGQAPDDTLLSLDSLLQEVRANNPSLRAAHLEAKALVTRSRQVSALPDPTVRLGYQPFPLLTARGTQRSQWQVEQMIPYPGKLGLQGDIADLSAEIVGLEAKTFEQELLFKVKQTYYELYRIHQQEALTLAFQDRLKNFSDNAAVQYAVGSGLQQAILKAQLEGNMLSLVMLDLAEQRRTAAETMARLLNRPTSDAFQGVIRVEALSLPVLEETMLMEIAFRERPEVKMLSTAAKRAEAQIVLAQKQFRPDFGLRLTYFDIGASDMPLATGRDAFALGASIKVPLQRDRLRASLEESRVRRSQVEARQEALESSFRTQIAELVGRLQEEAQQLALYREVLIPQAETTLQATLGAYTTGRTDFLDLLDAERTLFSLGTGYEDVFSRYLGVTAALERVLGIVSLDELE